ncbi:tRNA (adenosine(37)-N6)-dimethylallyltransferase MiaA [Heliorestis convoluta]|uniref:tRNA dimethylallyltransferase n=1 Tax=Heliorestis convoluta TaxID=356322 RepID=A0A5Q2N0M8_9FIRM|nr:tRNA (adenosine(37)-N6)-dimethylallyltransferase MiaA [Heliorestis convoluta]QGG46822.1 tRNA dimethylallyltransferase [Heliorestis convoluta]
MTTPSELLPLVAIVGPTAVGKSSLAIELAKRLDGEIISGDSMQVYRGMDIGTAKVSQEERQGIPHHLIDIIDPDQPYSVADFQKKVTELIPRIVASRRIPILVGGTGLYVRSIIAHYDFAEEAKDEQLRARLEREAIEVGLEAFHERLREIDEVAASRIHVNDRKRIIRALEVYYLTGKRQSDFHYAATVHQPKYQLSYIGLTMDRASLYHRIDLRAQNMIESGLVDEVQGLLEKGYSSDLPSMQGLGYRQIISYLNGDYDLSQALYLLQRDTRRYAKRQLTWFRRESSLQWFAVDNLDQDSLIQESERTVRKALREFIERR